jgi:hypothetical protein
MTSLWQVPAVVLSLLVAFADGPATLGTLARREALRRQMTPPAKTTLSNLSLPDPPPAAVTSDVVPPVAAAGDPPPAAEEGQKAEPPKDEKFWRDRIVKARQALTKDEAAIITAQGKANSLTNQVINIDDPAKQMTLRQQLLTALAEVERLKAQIEADRQAIAAIQVEARKAGIPPGWIRN